MMFAMKIKGHDVPATCANPRAFLSRLAVTFLLAIMLTSCMTGKKSADASPDAAEPLASETAGPARAPDKGATASSLYVDPMVSKEQRRQQAQAPTAQQTGPMAASDNSFPPPPPPQPASIGGLATQPTGVRAGSVSIFSSPAPAAAPLSTGAVPTGGSISPATGSVFTPRQPLPPTTCGTDAQGNGINC